MLMVVVRCCTFDSRMEEAFLTKVLRTNHNNEQDVAPYLLSMVTAQYGEGAAFRTGKVVVVIVVLFGASLYVCFHSSAGINAPD